ncbi:MAG: preprotein translocase subunit SecG [Paracoccus sp. (in: a-proteobacteria)]|uniref:preprotein translocase subunit SecG n=1 Tax=Paracoccus sp. TaxID=267 RepID=UPI0026DFFB0B|nr:preprotein translocase subunit SecG [Paracoccus sp. (in: a-proteobacteria)]MDO5622208.1 preprotein translocase subunit SecG [Paracoccus sp. (in: a-proteobacteria)]
MENVVLTVHLILALLLIGVVLLQRSEGGGLGMGGGGNTGGVMSGRQAANALSRLTWIFAAAFIVTSLVLTVMAARNSSTSSVMDQIGVPASQQPATGLPDLGAYTPPPGTATAPEAGAPILPPAVDAPAAPEAGSPVTPPAN